MCYNLLSVFNITPAALSSFMKASWCLSLSQKSRAHVIDVWRSKGQHSTTCHVIIFDL